MVNPINTFRGRKKKNIFPRNSGGEKKDIVYAFFKENGEVNGGFVEYV